MAKEYSITDLPERIASKIRIAESGCWEWISWKKNGGYGGLRVDRKIKCAHRVIFELLVGPIPEGLFLDHLCRVRHCVSPAHLEIVTTKENVHRGISVTALNARKAKCLYGHDYTSENNVNRNPGKGRGCRECSRLRHLAKSFGKSFAEVIADQYNPDYTRKFVLVHRNGKSLENRRRIISSMHEPKHSWVTKRFLLFAFNEYETGGWDDMMGSFDTEAEAVAAIGGIIPQECYEVVDLATGNVRSVVKYPGTPPGEINPEWKSLTEKK